MSAPQDRPTAEQPMVTPTLSTDPARSPWHWSALPSHLGRARTSTLVLGLLFLAIGALYLNIRPETTGTTTTGNTGPVVEESPAPTTTAPATPAPQTSTAPGTTADESTSPTVTDPTDTTAPTDTTEPTEPTDTAEPTATFPTLESPTAPNPSPSSPTP